MLEGLEPLIPLKMTADADKKEHGLADVFRSGHFQMAYYFKPTEIRHTVLEKVTSKNMVARSVEQAA